MNKNDKILNQKNEENKNTEENDFDDVDIKYNDPNFDEKIKRTEIIEEDIELLMVQGKDAIVERLIPLFNHKTNRYVRVKVDLSPLSRGEMAKIEQEGKRSKDKDTLIRVVSKGYKPKNRGQFTLEELKDMDSGFVKSLYDEINFISGNPIDGFTQLAVKQAFEGDT